MSDIAIPLQSIRKALYKLDYASPSRVMFQMLLYTGCRISELDRMKITGLSENVIFWRLGKNQRGERRKALPSVFIEELLKYRNNFTLGERLFHADSRSLVKDFNLHRKVIGDEWVEREKNRVTSYVLQLKGLRKTHATLCFWREYKEWDDPMIALEMVSKEMRHSTLHMTSYHYIRNFASLGISRDTPVFDVQSLNSSRQMRITEYYN